MPPKKKEKSKGVDWLQCSLCDRLVSNADAETHSKDCHGNHGYIQGKLLHGRAMKAETVLEEDGTSLTKSIRNSDSAIWTSIPAMQVCGLSIGQHCVVNKVRIMKSWPAKLPTLTSVAATKSTLELLGLDPGEEMVIQRFYPTQVLTEACTLRLHDPNPVFETEEFCSFAASYLDGCYVTEGSPLQINYFGQTCKCWVGSVSHSTDFAVESSMSDTCPGFADSLPEPHCTADSQDTSGTDQDQSSIDTHLCNAALMNSPNEELSDSLASLNISDTSQNIHSSTPKCPPKQQNFPNLNTPNLNVQDVDSKSGECHRFSCISSSITKISVKSGNDTAEEDRQSSCGPQLSDLGGLSAQIEELKSRIVRGQQSTSSSRCILIYGPPGCGKSMLTKALTSHLGVNSVFISGTDVWSKLFGEAEANLKRLFTVASDRAPSIIVMDDIDVMCPKRSQGRGGQQEGRIVGTLLSLIDSITLVKESSKTVVVLGVTSDRDGLDPALRRAGRFGCEVEVPVPSAADRIQILKVLLNRIPHTLSESDIETAAGNAHGYVGADLASLVNEACMRAYSRESASCEGSKPVVEVTLEDMVYAGLQVKPSALREVQLEVPQVKWSDIAGMTEVKMRLREAVELPLARPQVFHELGIEPPRGLLMYGPPGCSKTMVARAVGSECHLNFLAVKGPELFNQYVGESEKAIREVFRKARSAAPSVIFFDEIDAIAAKRGSSGSSSGVEDRVLTQLLTEMDGLEHLKDVFIMAATNRPDKIDNALLRPGRFDSLVYVPLPDDLTRREILEKKMTRMCISDDVEIDELVEATIDYSGAEIIQVCQEAALYALREDISTKFISARHFDFALTKVQPQIDTELLQIYAKFSHLKSK